MSEIITLPYAPEAFNKMNMDEAKGIILTPDHDQSVEDRWGLETPYLNGLIKRNFNLTNQVVVDYGCGIGRMSRGVVRMYNDAKVIGIDISPTMRAYSELYVDHPNFMVTTPEMFDFQLSLGLKADLVLSIWALQHMPFLDKEVDRINKTLKPGGYIFLVDEPIRYIPAKGNTNHPTGFHWLDDGFSVKDYLLKHFELVKEEKLDKIYVTEPTSKRVSWSIYRKA